MRTRRLGPMTKTDAKVETGILYHARRRQPYAVWHNEETVAFAQTRREAEMRLQTALLGGRERA